MARQTLTAAVTTGPWPTAGVAIAETAADASNKEQTLCTGREIIVARNSGVTTRSVTITSKADSRTGRTGDVTTTLTSGQTKMFGPFDPDGFRQASDGMVYFEAAHAEILWHVIRF